MLSQPLLQSSTHPSGGVLECKDELRSAKRLHLGKITQGNSAVITSLHFCNILVATCHGTRDGGSHPPQLGSLRTGHVGGWDEHYCSNSKCQKPKLAVPSPQNRPEPFSQKARGKREIAALFLNRLKVFFHLEQHLDKRFLEEKHLLLFSGASRQMHNAAVGAEQGFVQGNRLPLQVLKHFSLLLPINSLHRLSHSAGIT